MREKIRDRGRLEHIIEQLHNIDEFLCDKSFEDLPKMFRDLGLDDSLVKPSYVINVNALQAKINERIKQNPELNYNHDNAQFLNNILKELNLLMRSQNA